VTVELNNLPDFGHLVLLKYKKNLPEAPPEPPKQPAHCQNFMPELGQSASFFQSKHLPKKGKKAFRFWLWQATLARGWVS
jgi:hypothetical protein